jgi:hypothetical protein
MRIPRRDVIATCSVAAAVVLYLLWLADVALLGMSSVRATGLVILTLGFVASATAVVPGFDQLMHGSKVYLAATSVVGLVAFVTGVVMLGSGSSTAIAVLMAVMCVLWGVSTTHHFLLAKSERPHSHGDAAPVVGSGTKASVR